MTSTDHGITHAWPACALGTWSAAWLAGKCSPDDVADTLAAFAERHEVIDRTGDVDAAPRGVLGVLSAIRTAGELSVRLPGPGDPQGLPRGEATDAAFLVGQTLLLHDAESTRPPRALVPSSIADGVFRWLLFRYDQPVGLGTNLSVGDAEYELRQAVSEASSIIERLGARTSSQPSDLRGTIRTITAQHQVELPPHDDPRVERILATAAQIDAILAVAGNGGVTFGASSGDLHSGDGELRRLAGLTRTARATAVNRVIANYANGRA